MHARRVQPHEERFAVRLGLVDERQRVVADLVVDRFHARRTQLTGVLDLLLADLAPARVDRRIVGGRRPRVQHVARTHDIQQVLRIVRMARVFHRVEVVEVAVELVEPVHGRQEFVAVAEVVLAELARGVAHRLQDGCQRDRLRRQAGRRAGLTHGRHAGADRQLAGDEVRAARRTARFGVVVGEQHPFLGDLVEVRRAARHHAAVIRTDVPHPDVVTHDDEDVGFRSGIGRERRRRAHREQSARREHDRNQTFHVHVLSLSVVLHSKAAEITPNDGELPSFQPLRPTVTTRNPGLTSLPSGR